MTAQAEEYGDRTTVTAMVARNDVPLLSAELHSLLGADISADIRREYPHRVLLPGDTRSFGLAIGAAGNKPAMGSFTDVSKRHIASVPTTTGELWGIPLAHIGFYFGWSDPSGVRVEFRTLTGETYAVTISYIEPGANEELKFALIDALLQSGTKSVGTALTPGAAARWLPGSAPRQLQLNRVQLVEPPLREPVIKDSPASQPQQAQATDDES